MCSLGGRYDLLRSTSIVPRLGTLGTETGNAGSAPPKEAEVGVGGVFGCCGWCSSSVQHKGRVNHKRLEEISTVGSTVGHSSCFLKTGLGSTCLGAIHPTLPVNQVFTLPAEFNTHQPQMFLSAYAGCWNDSSWFITFEPSCARPLLLRQLSPFPNLTSWPHFPG